MAVVTKKEQASSGLLVGVLIPLTGLIDASLMGSERRMEFWSSQHLVVSSEKMQWTQ
jgi:hypothetical protein